MEPPAASLSARIAAATLVLFVMGAYGADAARILEPAGTIVLPGVKGRIDHLAADPKTHRLFIAALGNDALEVVGTQGGPRRSVAGLREPQGVALAGPSRLFVANGEGDRVDVLDASTLGVIRRVEDMPDADNVRYDEASRTVLVGYGKGVLALIDADKGALVARIALPGHPESFQLERNGPRVFVNVPSARQVVVVDRVKRATVASWGLPLAVGNYPMALDEEGHRLFVGTRLPAALLVYDTETGNVVARLSIGGDADDIFFDAARKRIYVICGEGRVDVVRQDSPDRYSLEASVETAPRARTGLLVPQERMLYVAAPAAGGSPARILVFRLP